MCGVTGRLGLRSADAESLTLEHVKSLPHAELAALWKDYVSALTGLLQEARGDPASPAGQRIGELIGEVRMVVSCLMSYSTHRWSTLRWVEDSILGSTLMFCLNTQYRGSYQQLYARLLCVRT